GTADQAVPIATVDVFEAAWRVARDDAPEVFRYPGDDHGLAASLPEIRSRLDAFLRPVLLPDR
ncbi:MAG: hypothetical protein AAGH15_20555, partial [Myxococcota bacterium]